MNNNNTNNNTLNNYAIEADNRLLRLWRMMIDRCYNVNSPGYKSYGAKGITVTLQWRNSYRSFCHWALRNGYAPDLEIDRIDGTQGYSPRNCRWVNHFVQLANRRPSETNNWGEYSFNRKRNLPYNVLHVMGAKNRNPSYKVEFSRNGVKYLIGHYKTVADAVVARDAALKQYADGTLKGGVAKKNLKTVISHD